MRAVSARLRERSGAGKSPAELADWRGFFIHELLEFHEFGGARERRAGKMRRREIGRRGNEGRNAFAPKFEMMIIRSKKKCFPGENSLLDDLHTGGGITVLLTYETHHHYYLTPRRGNALRERV